MKKEIKYSTPKEYQPGYESFHEVVPSKKPKNYCTKLKRSHIFAYSSTLDFEISGKNMGFHEFKCEGCGKKKITGLNEYSPVQKIKYDR